MTCSKSEPTLSQLAARYVAAWNAQDLCRLLSLFAEDGSYAEFGQGKVLLGREEIRRYLTAIFCAVPDLTTTPTGHPICHRERVLYKWIMTGTLQGEFAGVPPTGKRFEVQGATALVTKGTEILRAADFFDVRCVAGQLWSQRETYPDSGAPRPDTAAIDRIRREWLLADEDNIGYGE